MKLIITFINFLCIWFLVAGCTGNQGKTSNQERTSITDEQPSTLTKNRIDPPEKLPPEGEQIADHALEEVQQGITPTDPMVDTAQNHFLAFFSLLKTDIEGAEVELSKYVKTRFGAHPLADEWVKLFVRLARDQKGTFADIQRATQWHVQMLIDVKPEERTQAHAQLLTDLQEALNGLESVGKLLEAQGEDLETYEMPGRFGSP